MHALYFNLSACPGCSGRLTGFRLEIEGRGTLLLHGYSFEQEKPLETPRATVTSCLADATATTLTVTGRLCADALPAAYADGQLCLYAGTMADAHGLGASHETTAGKERVGASRCPLYPRTVGSAWRSCRPAGCDHPASLSAPAVRRGGGTAGTVPVRPLLCRKL